MKGDSIEQLTAVESLSFGSWYKEALKRLQKKVPRDKEKAALFLNFALLGGVVRALQYCGMTTEQIIDFIRKAEGQNG